MHQDKLISRLLILALLAAAPSAHAQFNPAPNPITTPQTGARTLTGGTGTITSTGSLTVTGSSAGVTMSGGTAVSPTTLVNSGTLQQTGTGRAVVSAGSGAYLVIQNNSTGVISSTNNDTVAAGTGSTTVASVSLTNAGTISSAAGGQAVNFNKILTAPNAITNSGSILATNSDAVRTGVNGTVDNSGTIKSIAVAGSSSDGIDLQANGGAVITNSTSNGLIEGGRDGITGGPATDIAFATTITNNTGATLQGDNGSGINLDGFSAKQITTVINHGTITGNGHDIGDGKSHDGDGVDVDGPVALTNTGTIRSVNAFNLAADGTAFSEGVSAGGGTITNSGTIEGLVASGNANAVGRGISLVGNDITSGPLAGTREAIYGDAVVTNQAGGLIRGDSDSGIFVGGPASGFAVTINNHAGATIQGGGTVNAAIRTGADNDTINQAGTIDGSSSGKALDLGGGNNTLNITGGSASILGNISGGLGGTNTLTIDPGAGQTFSYSGVISDFNNAEIKSGAVKLSGASTYAGPTTISGGTLFANNLTGSATGFGNLMVKNQATLAGNGTIGGNVFVESGGFLSPGNSPGTLAITGNLTLAGSSRLLFDLGANAANSDLLTIGGALGFSDSGSAIFDFTNHGAIVGDYTLLTFGSADGIDLSKFTLGKMDGLSGNLVLSANSVSLHITAVPEPATTAAWFGCALLGAAAWRKRHRQPARPAV